MLWLTVAVHCRWSFSAVGIFTIKGWLVMRSLIGFWFHDRVGSDGQIEGITVSKNEKLPSGEFELTEYLWGDVSLWFVKADGFSEGQRQSAYELFVSSR